MRLILGTLTEKLDKMIHDALRNKDVIELIVLTKEEMEKFKIELNYEDIKGISFIKYQGYPVEVEK
jgi:hypothetical protein